jgi:hypothetical protein
MSYQRGHFVDRAAVLESQRRERMAHVVEVEAARKAGQHARDGSLGRPDRPVYRDIWTVGERPAGSDVDFRRML